MVLARKMELGHLRGEFICFTGIDGTGKSTQALKLVDALKSQGIKARYIYLRTPHFISKPIMGLCRLNGITERMKTEDGTSVRGFHHFYRSKILSYLVPWLQAVDMHLYTWMYIRMPCLMGSTVVCDRHVTDTMVDMIIETRRPEIPRSSVGRFFMVAIPRKAKMIVLTGTPSAIRARKHDLKYDPYFEEKYEIFSKMENDLHRYICCRIDTTRRGVDDVFESVLKHIASDDSPEPRKWAKAARYVIWQGMSYMDSSERLWRLFCLAFVTAIFMVPVKILLSAGWMFSVVISVALAHLTNFVVNAAFWSTAICDLKLFQPKGKRALYQYLKGLRKRAASCDAIMSYCAFGSIARNNFHDASDLDMVLIRRPGFLNALRVFAFILSERLYALFHKIPIELWVGDSVDFLKRLRPDEAPVVIINNDNGLESYYKATQTIEQAIDANGDSHLFRSSASIREQIS